MLGLPARTSDVLSTNAQVRLGLALLGSLAIGFAEVGGLVAISPLMMLLTGAPLDEGALGSLWNLLGQPDREAFATTLAAVIFFSFLFKSLMTIVFRWWMIGMVAEQEVDTSVELLQHYFRMPYVNHVERGTPDLIRSMNDAVGTLYGGVLVGWLSAATETITITVVVLALLIVAPLPTLLLVAYFALAAGLFQFVIRRRALQLGEYLLHLSRHIYMAAFHALGGIKEIKLRHTGDYFASAYREARWEAAKTRRVSSLISELPKHLLEVIFILGVGIMSVVTFRLDAPASAVGTLVMFVAAGFRILPSTTRLLASVNGIRMGLSFGQLAINEVIEARSWAALHPTEIVVGALRPLPFERDVTFEDVCFRYPTSQSDVIADVSLTIPKGSSVAFVGGSGAGKSTLVDLLLGLHRPSSGHIKVDGVDVASLMPQWQTNLAMVPQDVYLMDLPLRENIAFGVRPETIDEARIQRAVQLAQLQPLVDELPHGLSTEVGERGGRLSGGQRQRIGIARALYSDPSLLVLDEATSALDNATERKISETIQSLHGNITVVIVAHRLSTVRHCDQIIFLREGRVEATGTFDEVQGLSPDFAHLVELGSLEAAAEQGAPT